MRSVSLALAVRKITGMAARSGSFRMPLQMSNPSESGSMMSSRIRSGRCCRHSSMAPFPVCCPDKLVRALLPAQLDGTLSGVLPRQGETLLFQVVPQQGKQVRVVFDEQDFFHGVTVTIPPHVL